MRNRVRFVALTLVSIFLVLASTFTAISQTTNSVSVADDFGDSSCHCVEINNAGGLTDRVLSEPGITIAPSGFCWRNDQLVGKQVCEKRSPAQPQQNQQASAAYEQGLQSFLIGNYREAIENFNRAIELDPAHPNAYFDRGNIYLNLEENIKALKDFDQAIQNNPSRIEDYINGGEDKRVDQIISGITILADLSPVGTVKGWLDAIIGEDIITGEKLETWERLLNLVPGGSQARRAGTLAKRTLPRFDYSLDFEADLKNFNPGAKLRDSPLERDLILVQYHRGDVTLGNGRSARWWTSPEQANQLSTIDDIKDSVMERLALPPEWGPRDAISVARIPAGTRVPHYEGTASPQNSDLLGRLLGGGGVQYRFKEFDPNWIVETRRLPR